MSFFIRRFAEPSTYAGIAGIASSVAGVISSKGTDAQSLAVLIASIMAIVAPEKGLQK